MSPLEEKLIQLSKFGEPMLFKMKKGWWCKLEIFVTGKGVTVEVKSDSDSSTPTTAVDQCIDRLQTLLQSMQETTKNFQSTLKG